MARSMQPSHRAPYGLDRRLTLRRMWHRCSQSQRMSANTARDTGNHGGTAASHDAVAEGRSRAEEERERAAVVEQAAREAAARRQQEQQHTVRKQRLSELCMDVPLVVRCIAHLDDCDGVVLRCWWTRIRRRNWRGWTQRRCCSATMHTWRIWME